MAERWSRKRLGPGSQRPRELAAEAEVAGLKKKRQKAREQRRKLRRQRKQKRRRPKSRKRKKKKPERKRGLRWQG